MGYSVFPAPASGPTLQQIKDGVLDNWTLISSVTPTSGSSTVSFTGLSGYQKFWLVFNDLSFNNSTNVNVRVNNNGGNVYPAWYFRSDGNPYYGPVDRLLNTPITAANQHVGSYVFESVNQTVIKQVSYRGWCNAANTIVAQGEAHILDTAAITSIQVYPTAGATYNATGTVYLYGVAA